MIGGIYTIRVEGSDKFYIGRTKKFTERKATHMRLLRRNEHHCKHLQNAFNKYGSVKFVAEQEENDKQKRIQLEQEWIDRHKFTGLLVNVHLKASYDDQGDKPWGKDRKRPAPYNKGMPSPFRGTKRDPSIGAKISASKKSKPISEKQACALAKNRKKIDHSKPRKPMSEETRKKMIGNKNGIGKRSAEAKAAISRGKKGVVFTESHKEKLREAALRRYAK